VRGGGSSGVLSAALPSSVTIFRKLAVGRDATVQDLLPINARALPLNQRLPSTNGRTSSSMHVSLLLLRDGESNDWNVELRDMGKQLLKEQIERDK
jgi:hypothetical protein